MTYAVFVVVVVRSGVGPRLVVVYDPLRLSVCSPGAAKVVIHIIVMDVRLVVWCTISCATLHLEYYSI